MKSEEPNQLPKSKESPGFSLQIGNDGQVAEQESKMLLPAEKVAGYYEEIMGNLRSDREQAQQVYEIFAEMVVNEGDPSAASKEAMINALKLRHDANDKSLKLLDLCTRMWLKDKSTSTEIYAYQQNNKYENNSQPQAINVRRLIQEVEQELPNVNNKSD